jgi:hypothetical protein
MVHALVAQMQNDIFLETGSPVTWMSLFFGIRQPRMVYHATINLISKIT